jgi:hypothetical protein
VVGPLNSLGTAAKLCLVAGIPNVRQPPFDAGSFREESSALIAEGLGPVALEVIDRNGGERDHDLRAPFFSNSMARQMHSLAADAIVGNLVTILAESGVQPVLIKGPAVARLHPPDWPRPYSDIDLLVRPDQFERAMGRLVQEGYDYPETSRPPWFWFDRYCREGVNLHGAGNVDLHHHIAPWVFVGHLTSQDVLAAGTTVTLHGVDVTVASPSHSVVIAALHILNDLWKGQRGLVSWRDIIILLQSTDAMAVRQVFIRANLEWLLDLVITELHDTVPYAVEGLGSPVRTPMAARWRIRGLGWQGSTALSRHRAAWMIRLPWPQAWAFAAGTAVPSPSFIRARHRTYRQYWRQAWDETVTTVGGADHRMDKSDNLPLPSMGEE